MFSGNKRMRTVTNFFIFNLALTDLINTIFNSIFNFIFMKNKWVEYYTWQNIFITRTIIYEYREDIGSWSLLLLLTNLCKDPARCIVAISRIRVWLFYSLFIHLPQLQRLAVRLQLLPADQLHVSPLHRGLRPHHGRHRHREVSRNE